MQIWMTKSDIFGQKKNECRHAMPGQLTKLFSRADVKIQFGRNRQSERRLLNACNTKKEKNSEQMPGAVDESRNDIPEKWT